MVCIVVHSDEQNDSWWSINTLHVLKILEVLEREGQNGSCISSDLVNIVGSLSWSGLESGLSRLNVDVTDMVVDGVSGCRVVMLVSCILMTEDVHGCMLESLGILHWHIVVLCHPVSHFLI